MWNKQNIQYKNRYIFNHTWLDNGTLTVSYSIKMVAFLCYEEFLDKFKMLIKPKEYAIVFDIIIV